MFNTWTNGTNSLIAIPLEYVYYLGIPLLFLVLVAWIFRSGKKRQYANDGNIPFNRDSRDGKAG